MVYINANIGYILSPLLYCIFHFVYSGIDPMDKAFDDLSKKLNNMVEELHVHIKKARAEDPDYRYEEDYDYENSSRQIFISQ